MELTGGMIGYSIDSLGEYLDSIAYDVAFSVFTCSGSSYNGETPSAVGAWGYGSGFTIRRGTNSFAILWIKENAVAFGYGDKTNLKWKVFDS